MTTSPRPAVLVVDDEVCVRDLIGRWLVSGGYDVATAGNADEALSRVHAAPPAVAVCDIRMPGQDGLWLAQRIRQDSPETAVIMATGMHDVGSAVTSLRHGVIDYLTKPLARDRLREAVSRGLVWHQAASETRRWRESLEREMEAKRQRLSGMIGALNIDSDAALDAMLVTLTIDDRDAYAHAYRVAAMAVSMGRALGLADAAVAALEHGALLHDIGKFAIPEAVLRKPAPLTQEEQLLVRLHPLVGANLIEPIPYLAAAAPLVRDARERPDGLGYPRGIPGVDIAPGARVIAVADAYDTMTRPRVFRDAISPRDALIELARCAGTQFDSAVVDVFRRVITPDLPSDRD